MTAFGLEFAGAAGIASEWSDNSNLAEDSDGRLSEWIHSPRVELAGTHQSDALDFNATYTAYRRIHQEDRFEDETALTARGSLVWNVVQNRLIMELGHNRSERTVQADQRATPDNLQETQNAIGKLTYVQPLFRTHSLIASASVQDEYYEQTDNDGETRSFDLMYSVELAEYRRISLFYREDDHDFDNFPLSDYESESFGLRFSSTGRHGGLDVEIGRTETDRNPLFQDVSGGTGNLRLFSSPENGISWYLEAFRTIDDQSNDATSPRFGFRALSLLDEDNSATTDIFVEEGARAGLAWNVGRSRFGIDLFHRDQDYEVVDLDRKQKSASVSLERQVSTSTSIELSFRLSEIDFVGRGYIDDLWESSASFTRQVSPRFEVGLAANYRDRSSDGLGQEFEELFFLVDLEYRFGSL